jgi:hypothetical protein
MIKLIKLIIDRLKRGYRIADNCYLVSGTRDELVVACGDRKVKFCMERLRGKPNRIIYKRADKKWLPPHESESISDDQYQFILNALVDHFEKLGEVVECQ